MIGAPDSRVCKTNAIARKLHATYNGSLLKSREEETHTGAGGSATLFRTVSRVVSARKPTAP
ncbi:hypothetical protein PG995_002660 [Apiospora arundinis]